MTGDGVTETGAHHDEDGLMTAREAEVRRRLGTQLRRLGHNVVGNHMDLAVLDELADALGRLADVADTGSSRTRPLASYLEHHTTHSTAGLLKSYDDRPFSGEASPWGIDLAIHRVDDDAVADVTFGSAHEGAPGRAHGGIVAGLFDDVFGFVLGIIATAAFTGELKIRYHAPTPLHTPLVCRGHLDARDGRKLWITGDLRDGDTVVASATGLFITVDPALFRAASQQLPAPQ